MSYELSSDYELTTACPYFPPEERERLQAELNDILMTKLSMGPRTQAFQDAFADLCGVDHAVAFPNCTAALEAALLAVGVGPGDEVLVPVETFVATGMAVHLIGARPVFTEVSPDTFSMDTEDAWSRVTDRTRGAIVVHFGGLIDPALVEFVDRMRRGGRFVIEDAAHAPGAELDGRLAGAFGDAGCFSFYPTKVITTGEGGMLTTNRADVAAAARSIQDRGRDLDATTELYVRAARSNRFTEIAAAMGLSQLRSLPRFLERRRAVAAVYDDQFGASELVRPVVPPRGAPSYWRYTLVPRVPFDRVALRERLLEEGISIDWAYTPPLHLQPIFKSLYATSEGMLPRSEELLAHHVCLPVHARMKNADAEYVAERVLEHCAALAA
jgi:perosamine synthetase